MRSRQHPSRLLLTLFLILGTLLAPLQALHVNAQEARLSGNLHVVHSELDSQYYAAILDAMEMRASKINTQLVLISKSNPSLQWKAIEGKDYVKMGMLTGTFFDDKVGKPVAQSAGRISWVFAPYEMKQWYAAHKPAPANLILRLRQLLGMPADVQKTRIVEVWVRPEDLKRPSLAPEIDKEIDLATFFQGPSGASNYTWWTPHGDDAFNSWFYQQCANSYVIPTDRTSIYPWTRLGYTYDWGTAEYPHIGLSEFIIWGGTGVNIYVESTQKPEDYLK